MTDLRKIAIVSCLVAMGGCDALLSGLPADEDIFDGPIEGLTSAQTATFLAGDEDFGRFFTAEEGLGPIFNQPSCISCHPNDGRGHPSTNLIRFGRGDSSNSAAFDYLTQLGGPQLQDHAIVGSVPETLPPNVAISERGGPVATGLGLIEAIPAATILAGEDPNDADGDGIRGVANFVHAPEFLAPDENCSCGSCRMFPDGCRVLGRFGRKATAVSLLHQTVAAYFNDMGLTTDFFTEDIFNPTIGGPTGDRAPDPEVSSDIVANVVFYLQTLRPPERRNVDDPQVSAGESIFSDIGCATCHTPSMTTSADTPVAALRGKTVRLYSDMLLHDMGDKLADGFPEGQATGRQWRTTPLWGIGIVAGQLGGQAFYLHDGRAKTLDEAIREHGGEADGTVAAYLALPASERGSLIAFLRSL